MSALSLKARDGDRPGETVIEVTAPGRLPLPEQPGLAIRRRGYPLGNLGPGGWQMAEAALQPSAVRRTAEGLELVVGPEIAHHLERGNYELALSGPGMAEPLTGVLAWSGVRGVGAGPTRRRAGRLAAAELGAVPTAPPEPAPQPVAAVPPPALEDAPPAPVVIDEAVVADETKLWDQGAPVPPPPPRRRLWPAAAAASVLLTAGLGWWLWPSPRQPATTAPAPATAPGPSQTEAARPAATTPGGSGAGSTASVGTAGTGAPPSPAPAPTSPAPTAPAPAAQQTAALAPLDQARKFLDSNPPRTPAQIFDKAAEFQAQGSMEAAVPLFRRAADAGEARAADALGRLYDPANFAPPGAPPRRTQMPEPNPRFAAMWYQRAVSGGDPAAAQNLQNLIAWAKAHAAQGDQAAAELLAKLQP